MFVGAPMTMVFFGFGFLLTGINFFSAAEVDARESFRKRGREPGIMQIGLGFGPASELSIAVFFQRLVSVIAIAAGFGIILQQAHIPRLAESRAAVFVLAAGLTAIAARLLLTANTEDRKRVAGVTKWGANLAIFAAMALMIFSARSGK